MPSLASWFGNLSQSVNIYCERASAAWDAEPLNAVSNLAFFIAAWAVWRLQKERPNLVFGGGIKSLWIVIAVVGAGSFTFHTLATRWAEWADVIPILIFMIVYCWLLLTAFLGWPIWLKLLATLVFFAATFFLESDEFENVLWGGAMYLPTLLFMVGAGFGVWRRDANAGKAFFTAAALFAASFAARTLDKPLCSLIPFGTHYLWHVLNATVLYLLVRTLIIHAPGGAQAIGRASRREANAAGKPAST